jgi:Na+/H+-dicarboxylate symporter/ABC-type amino acid transport substrate-binding protein
MSLATQVLLSLVLGLTTGLFFGEMVSFLMVVGRAFIMLLQMTVLPYAVVSLIAGLGRLSVGQAKSLAVKGGGFLLLFWGMALIVVALTPLAFPQWESSSFFSTTLTETEQKRNLLNLYIPANPFQSMAESVVPAVVLFSLALGVALIGVKNKNRLIEPLSAFGEALMRVTMYVARLMPVGVFAIAASASGTIQVDEFGRLQVYFVTFIAVALVMALWIVPALVTSLIPLSYRDFLGLSRDVLITAFAIGNLFVVMPILIQKSKVLLEKLDLASPETSSTVDVLVPASFNFPNLGHLLTLSFILFAGWFAGAAVSITKYPAFLIAGLFSMFGKPQAGIPFMLDMMRIPSDMFQLFIVTAVMNGRFGTLLSAVSILGLAVLVSCAMAGKLVFKWASMVRFCLVSALILALILGGLNIFFSRAIENAYSKDKVLLGMQLLRDPVPAKVHKAVAQIAASEVEPGTSTMARILGRRLIRVGYFRDQLPFSFFNASGRLVGFDVEMAHALAKDLKVDLEFVPVERDTFGELLDRGYCDIVMSSVAVTPERAQQVSFSRPYLNLTVALVVKDHRLDDFNTRDKLRALKSIRIGSLNVPYYLEKVHRYLPQAQIVPLKSIEEFFKNEEEDCDALLISAEAGSAWTLIYPAYSVAIPRPDVITGPAAYAVAKGDKELCDFVNNWIVLKKQDRTITRLYDYWILGKAATHKKPRWSVIRNVLHWVD